MGKGSYPVPFDPDLTKDYVDKRIPAGVILMWSGAVNDVPVGWVLCDGSNGTPDLRDRFIVGAGGAYEPGATGGEDTVALTEAQIPSHDHVVNPPSTASSIDKHAHNVSTLTKTAGTPGTAGDNGGSSVAQGATSGRFASSQGGTTDVDEHSHSVDIAPFASGAAGSGQAHENRPPYYAVVLIMKT